METKAITKRIPENVRIHIQEIAERMSQGRAVVMVGSGFSKNAKNYRYTEKKFLDWKQLGDIFYKKLYGRLPEEEEYPCYYQDPLKLAEKVQQCFGRTALEKLILDHLPDEEYEPSELHETLLKLNWTDIFTTNYDTLLERARARVFNKRYQVVLNKEDLVYSKCPRIIKLHGSFPSTRPFIITEEDYRKYPQDFAVFVNTVRQALIENVMCMIGFSGDDPNFLNWIGWVRDCLGREASSKIYLIGMFDRVEIERKLCASRNIELINMKECCGIEDGVYADGLKLFFEAIEFYQKGEEEDKFQKHLKEDVYVEWIKNTTKILLKRHSLEQLKTAKQNISRISDIWRTEREDDIDWFVMPYQRRRTIEKTLEFEDALAEALNTDEVLEDMIDLAGKFLYEYNWRRERCFFSLKPGGAKTYERYICLTLAKEKWKENDIELIFSLLEYWREHGEFEQWEALVEKIKDHLDDAQKKRLCCEKAMKMLYNLECGDLANILIDLTGSVQRAGMEFKISSLLAELGYYERAILLLKKNLDAVRKQTGNYIDYHNFSREAYLIDLLEHLEKYYNHLAGTVDSRKDMDSHSRLKTLKSYDCNPEYERDYLIQQLITYIHHDDADIPCKLADEARPEQYIKFMERTGMVFRTAYFFEHTVEFPILLRGMVQTNPYFAVLCTFRFGDQAVCKQIWNKEALHGMEPGTADRLIEKCIKACEANEEYIHSEKVKDNNLAINLPELAPHIIAGLLQRASVDGSCRAMEFASRKLESFNKFFSGMEKMLQSAVSRLVELKPRDLLTRWMGFPLGLKKKEEVLEPFLYMDLTVTDVDVPDNEQMETLKQKLESAERKYEWAVYTRLLVIEIICNTGSKESKILEKAKKNPLERPEFSEIIACYEVEYGSEEKKKQEKKEWIEQLKKQVDELSEKGRKYGANFLSEIKILLKRVEFYRKKCASFKWTSEEWNQIVDITGKWADAVFEIISSTRGEFAYYDDWCILENILLKVLQSEKVEQEVRNCDELQSLEAKLRRLEIPFLLGKVIRQWNNEDDGGINKLFVAAFMKGEREQDEARRILNCCQQFNDAGEDAL